MLSTEEVTLSKLVEILTSGPMDVKATIKDCKEVMGAVGPLLKANLEVILKPPNSKVVMEAAIKHIDTAAAKLHSTITFTEALSNKQAELMHRLTTLTSHPLTTNSAPNTSTANKPCSWAEVAAHRMMDDLHATPHHPYTHLTK